MRALSLLPQPGRMLIFPGIINATGRVGAVEWLARPLKPAFSTTLFWAPDATP